MQYNELVKKAKIIRDAYSQINQKQGQKPWGFAEHMQGFVGDVGDLQKLVMARAGLRACPDLEKKLSHELGDCLWSLMIIADELGIDLEQSFLKTMDELAKRTGAQA